jgi:hypothetical protein
MSVASSRASFVRESDEFAAVDGRAGGILAIRTVTAPAVTLRIDPSPDSSEDSF